MHTRVSLLFAAAASLALVSVAGAQLKLPRPSPGATVKQTVGLTDFTLTYSRPGVKGRKIWGDLVPYDKPWRTGANEATSFTTSDEIQFGGQKLAAGTYSLSTIPTTGQWTFVLNRGTALPGTKDYKTDDDVLRVQVKPTATTDHTEWMQFTFEDLANESANLVLRWEKLKVAVPIKVDANSKALANARAAVDTAKVDDWRTLYQAASFTFNNDVAKDEGRKWLEKSITIKPHLFNLTLLARWQEKEGKRKEAIVTAKQAILAGKAADDKPDVSGTEKLVAEWSAK